MTETPTPATEASEEPVMNQKLLKQVEYYFGDNNLPRDRFIKEECSKNEGWMRIETLLSFNRIKTIVNEVSEDGRVAKIAEILKASELVNVDDTGKKVRRNPEIPITDDNSENRTVYIKGFHRTETELDQLLDFFGKYEGMEAVIMRYYKEKVIETEVVKPDSEAADKEANVKEEKPKVEPKIVWARKFKGSIFVVFKTPEQAQKVLDDELVFRGTKLEIKMLHSAYRKNKLEEYKARLEARNKKRKREAGDDEDEADAKNEDGRKDEKNQDDIVKGALLKVKNLPKGFSREDFKEKWYSVTNEEECKIVFADFQKGDTEGVLRLEKEGSAAVALKLLPDGKLKVDDETEIEVIAFPEEEEKEYLKEIARKRLEKKKKPQMKFGGGRGRGRGGKRRKY